MTHYQQSASFYRNYEQGHFKAAEKALSSNEKIQRKKNQILYYLNMGLVHSTQGEYEASNRYFEEAYTLGEDYRKNYLLEVASYLSNPTILQYRAEDYELLLIHYYKALNFLKLEDNASALVECKRMNIKLKAMADKYDSPKKYRQDAFIHTLMGLIYEANGDINNAFIAYRNAYEIYQEDYQNLFGISAPRQLKKDILRSAYLLGFQSELRRFEEEFGMKYEKRPSGQGELVFLWHNGFGPVKDEYSINLFLNRRGRSVFFVNKNLNLNFDFDLPIRKDDDGNSFDPVGNISSLRVAFPRYIERPLYFESARLRTNNQRQDLELLEDINAISFKTLRQRMVLEVGKGALRLAIKKSQEAALRNKDQKVLATLLSFVNSGTEKADTRAWQAIPHSIYYTRMSLPPGEQKVQLDLMGSGENRSHTFTFQARRNQTIFHTFHSLEKGQGLGNYSMYRP